MMSRKDHIDRRLRKIEKSENKALKMLYKQRKELDRAIDDNQKLIDQKLSRGTPAENKIEAEVEKLEAVSNIRLTSSATLQKVSTKSDVTVP